LLFSRSACSAVAEVTLEQRDGIGDHATTVTCAPGRADGEARRPLLGVGLSRA
jgi:hypothetical protein